MVREGNREIGRESKRIASGMMQISPNYYPYKIKKINFIKYLHV